MGGAVKTQEQHCSKDEQTKIIVLYYMHVRVRVGRHEYTRGGEPASLPALATALSRSVSQSVSASAAAVPNNLCTTLYLYDRVHRGKGISSEARYICLYYIYVACIWDVVATAACSGKVGD